MNEQIDRARGCLFGQLIGDALGSLVEFQTPDQIARQYPDGVTDMHDGGTWNTIAGQPTDDSEMALALGRTIVEAGDYDQGRARNAYVDWIESGPFDVGNTTQAGLQGVPNFDSQANGALMRVSPLGIFGAETDPDLLARYAREDAWITHPHEVTQDANVLYVLTIARTIQHGGEPGDILALADQILAEHQLSAPVRESFERGQIDPPDSFLDRQGWVLIALRNAVFQLRHARSFEEAVVDTVGRGGDTDTNGAIVGALLGAVYGLSGIPERWVRVIQQCRPERGMPQVNRPRPRTYWPNDAAELAERLLRSGMNSA